MMRNITPSRNGINHVHVVSSVKKTSSDYILISFSGLCLFIGLIVYIALLKGEIGAKLVPTSLLSPPRLSYAYGWSFLLLICSFLCCEVNMTI